MFDEYLDVIFDSFSIGDCLDALQDEATAEAGWNRYVELVGSNAESDYWNEGSNVHEQWDYSEFCKHCSTVMKIRMESLSLDELLKALEYGEEVMDYADAQTKSVFDAWKMQQSLMASLSEKSASRVVKI